jgi:hypothetical protein
MITLLSSFIAKFAELDFTRGDFPLALLVFGLIALSAITILRIKGPRHRIAREKHSLKAGEVDRDATSVAQARESATGPVKDAVFELVGMQRGCSYTLRVLSGENKSISFETLLKKVWLKQGLHSDMDLLPGSAVRAVLRLLQGPGFVKMNQSGFFITELGKALCQRIERASRNSTVKEAPRPSDHSCGQERDDRGLNGQKRNRAIAGEFAV